MNGKVLSGEKIFAIILTLFGVIWTISGFRTGVWFDDAPAGGFMLIIIGISLTLLGAVVIAGLVRSTMKKQPVDHLMSLKDKKKVMLVLVFAIAGLLFMNYLLGTLITLTLFLLAWFRFYAHLNLKRNILFTICIMASVYGVFVLWLNVSFPTFLGLGFI